MSNIIFFGATGICTINIRYVQSDPIGLNGQQVTASGAALSAATSVAGGVIAGPIARNDLPFSTSSSFFPPRHAQQLNNQTAIVANAGSSNLLRSAGAGDVSNTDPTGSGCGCP